MNQNKMFEDVGQQKINVTRRYMAKSCTVEKAPIFACVEDVFL